MDTMTSKLLRMVGIPTIKIHVEIEDMANTTTTEVLLEGHDAVDKLCQLCKEHNVAFKADRFSDMISEDDYVEYRRDVTIIEGYEMRAYHEEYILKNIGLINILVSPLFGTITNFDDILTPKSFAETLNIGSRLESRLEVIQSALHMTISIIKHYGQGVGWGQVINRIFSIINNICGILGAIKKSDPDIDKKLSSLREDISNMFDVEV